MEEFTLVGYEMVWTVKYYLHNAGVWENRGRAARYAGNEGAVAYAAQKAAMWRTVAASADRQFSIVNNAYTSLV